MSAPGGGWTGCATGDRAEKHMTMQSSLPSPYLSSRHAGATPIYFSHRVVLSWCFLPLVCNDLADRTVMQLNYCLNPRKEEAK